MGSKFSPRNEVQRCASWYLQLHSVVPPLLPVGIRLVM